MVDFEIRDSLQQAIISYFSGDLTSAQAQELIIWLNQSPDNLKHFQSIGEIWYSTGAGKEHYYSSAKALEKVRKKLIERDIREVPDKTIGISISVLYNSAATLLVVAFLSIAIIYLVKKPETDKSVLSYFEAVAPKGSRSQMILSDGTQIWLNAGTTIKYNSDYGKSNRDIYLDGEAFFRVSKNENIPFKVSTSEIRITALGTAFNVKSYSEEGYIETTLEEGSLRIDPIKGLSSPKESETIILKSNEKAVVLKIPGPETVIPEIIENILPPPPLASAASNVEKLEALPVKVTSVPDTKIYTSWKDTNWVFKNEKLRTLAPKLERRYDITIEFADTSLLNYAFTGTLKDESIEQVLEIIRLSAPIKFIVDSKEVTLQFDEKMQKNFDKLIKP